MRVAAGPSTRISRLAPVPPREADSGTGGGRRAQVSPTISRDRALSASAPWPNRASSALSAGAMALAAGGGGRGAGRVRILANMRRASAWLGKVRIIAPMLSPRMSPVAKNHADVSATIRAALLAWYDDNARVLPWRARPGTRVDPYRVWLSEIMLQQTTVAHATPYFVAFTPRWPTARDLPPPPDADPMP